MELIENAVRKIVLTTSRRVGLYRSPDLLLARVMVGCLSAVSVVQNLQLFQYGSVPFDI